MRHAIAVVRSVLAFVVPALLANLILLLMPVLGRRRARNVSSHVIARLAPGLAGFSITIDGDVGALAIRPAVLIFNHQSGIDPVIMAAIAGRDCIGVAKRRLRRHPLLGLLLRLAGTLFVDVDGDSRDTVAQAAKRLLQGNLAVAIAPEGTRSRTLKPFRSGALQLAQAASVPIVAVVIHNSAEILAPHNLVMRPGTVRVTVLAARQANDTTISGLEQSFRHALDRDTPAWPDGGHTGNNRR